MTGAPACFIVAPGARHQGEVRALPDAAGVGQSESRLKFAMASRCATRGSTSSFERP
jgi:hypothetical protein